MAIEEIPSDGAVKTAFEHPIYASDGSVLPFSSLFDNHNESSSPPDRILVIFIRHFFCGNCQEYIRRLSSVQSPFHPSHKPHSTKSASHPLPSVVIIGPGLPSLIATYIRITQCAFPVYCDPSTQLYDILGMHRSLSLGHKAPVYIQHSLFKGAVKSALQIVRRVGNGDATGGGDWNVNGGEFLFLQPRVDVTETKSTSPSRLPGRRAQSSNRSTASRSVSSSSSASTLGWEISWCHRMLNSRDHTELHQLHYKTCHAMVSSSRTPSPPRSILVNGNRQPQSQRSQTLPNTSTESVKSYSNDCQGVCPGPDIPRSREQILSPRSQSPATATAKRTGSRSRSRSASMGASTVAIAPRPRSSASRAKDHRRNDSNTSTSTPEAQPRKSFSESIVEKVGGLVRSKSHSTKSSGRHDADDHDLKRRPSARSQQNHDAHRPRISLSLARSKLLSMANTDPILSTSAISAPITIPPPPPEPVSDLEVSTRSRIPAAVTSVGPAPVRSQSRSRSRSQSHSRSESKQRTSSRRENQVDMDENGIMVIDGVEFVNVIPVQARVDIAATATRSRATSMTTDAVIQQRPRETQGEQRKEQQPGQMRQKQPRNQGYTRGSVGLNLLTDRSTAALAARLAATSTPQIGTGEALGIVGGTHSHEMHHPLNHHHHYHHQHGGFESNMAVAAGSPAISSH